jgi:hypothetical protein
MSPDGQTVVFSRAYVGEDGGGDDIDRTYPVGWSYFHNAFDGFQCEVDGQWGWYCGAARPSWSPDGTQVGYGAEGYDNVQWICVINADDQTAGTRLVQGWSPLWSPATAR